MSIANLFDGSGKIASQYLPSSITPNQTFSQILANNNSAGGNDITNLDTCTLNTLNVGNWTVQQNNSDALQYSYPTSGGSVLSMTPKGNFSLGNSSLTAPICSLVGSKGSGKLFDSIYNIPTMSEILTNSTDCGNKNLTNVGLINGINISSLSAGRMILYNMTTNFLIPSSTFTVIPFNNTAYYTETPPDVELQEGGIIANTNINTIVIQVNVNLQISTVGAGVGFSIVAIIYRTEGSETISSFQLTPTTYTSTYFMSFSGVVMLPQTDSFSIKIMQTADGDDNNATLTANVCKVSILQLN